MTIDPAMTIEETHHLKTLENPEAQVVQALQFYSRLHELSCFEAVLKKSQEAYARGRRDGLREAYNASATVGVTSVNEAKMEIHALIEKEKQDV